MSTKKIKIWIEAARPQTLAAAFVPVLAGTSLAYRDNVLDFSISIITLACAFLIQIGTNFANDYYDFQKGADRDDRIGFQRATATGLISSSQMKWATVITMLLAFLLGIYLVWHAGWPVLLIGTASLLFGVLYTGGPFPLAYNGLGDVFVFIFFGIIAVMGTYYVNAISWSVESFWLSLSIGALSTNILVVNNLRDIHQDASAGKNTLGVLLGESFLKWEYLIMLLLAYAIPVYFVFSLGYSTYILLPFLTIPLGLRLFYIVITHDNKRLLNNTLKQTAQFMALYGILISTGILLSP